MCYFNFISGILKIYFNFCSNVIDAHTIRRRSPLTINQNNAQIENQRITEDTNYYQPVHQIAKADSKAVNIHGSNNQNINPGQWFPQNQQVNQHTHYQQNIQQNNYQHNQYQQNNQNNQYQQNNQQNQYQKNQYQQNNQQNLNQYEQNNQNTLNQYQQYNQQNNQQNQYSMAGWNFASDWKIPFCNPNLNKQFFFKIKFFTTSYAEKFTK